MRRYVIHDSGQLKGRNVLLIGQGPSSWGLSESDAWREIRGDTDTIVMNLAWQEYEGATWCFAMDPPMAFGLFRERVYERTRIVVPQHEARNWIHSGHEIPEGLVWGQNAYATGRVDGGASTGMVAFRALLWGHARSVTMIGFDGARDPRSRYTGQPGYQLGPTRPAAHAVWERRMVAWHRQHEAGDRPRMEVYLAAGHEDALGLDGCASGRIITGGHDGWRTLVDHLRRLRGRSGECRVSRSTQPARS